MPQTHRYGCQALFINKEITIKFVMSSRFRESHLKRMNIPLIILSFPLFSKMLIVSVLLGSVTSATPTVSVDLDLNAATTPFPHYWKRSFGRCAPQHKQLMCYSIVEPQPSFALLLSTFCFKLQHLLLCVQAAQPSNGIPCCQMCRQVHVCTCASYWCSFFPLKAV